MPILITGLFAPSGGAGAFDLYAPEDIQAGDVNVILQAIAGGSFKGGSHATVPVGEIVAQVKTTTGAPSHSASLGTLCWNSVDLILYLNNNGSTGWTAIGSGSGTVGPMGPPGYPGEEGEPGPIGPPGQAGLAGATGATGAAGSAGATGPPGVDGAEGEPWPPIPGPQGIQGVQGTAGTTGAVGPAGLMGPPGWDGEEGLDGWPGPTGAAGATGSQGTAGAAGVAGAMGPPGIDGLEGEPGPPIPGPIGAAGATGATGSAGAIGQMGPPGQNGEDGESFILGIPTVPSERAINIAVDGGGSVIAAGTKTFVIIPFACTIKNWYIQGDAEPVTNNLVIDIHKLTAGTPPTSASICASEKPTLQTSDTDHYATGACSGWTTTVAAGDIWEIQVDATAPASGTTLATLCVKVTVP